MLKVWTSESPENPIGDLHLFYPTEAELRVGEVKVRVTNNHRRKLERGTVSYAAYRFFRLSL